MPHQHAVRLPNATNLIHRYAEMRAGVLCRIRHHNRLPFSAKANLIAALIAIDGCCEAAEILREVVASSRRLYLREIGLVKSAQLSPPSCQAAKDAAQLQTLAA